MKKLFILQLLLPGVLFSCLRAGDIHTEAFTNIYNNAVWGKNNQGEGFSGGGSTFEKTVKYRKLLQNFLKEKNIKSVVDIGCGDWEFSKYINWDGIDYIGFDVVDWVIKNDISRFSNDHIHFFTSNFLDEDLPEADLLLCKHVLQHLSNEDVLKLIPQFKKYKYCLVTNEVDRHSLTSNNVDIKPGGCRTIDLTRAPFNIRGKKLLSYSPQNFEMHQVLLIEN